MPLLDQQLLNLKIRYIAIYTAVGKLVINCVNMSTMMAVWQSNVALSIPIGINMKYT